MVLRRTLTRGGLLDKAQGSNQGRHWDPDPMGSPSESRNSVLKKFGIGIDYSRFLDWDWNRFFFQNFRIEIDFSIFFLIRIDFSKFWDWDWDWFLKFLVLGVNSEKFKIGIKIWKIWDWDLLWKFLGLKLILLGYNFGLGWDSFSDRWF